MRFLRLRTFPLLLIILTVLVETMPVQAFPEQAERVEVQIRTVNLNKEPIAGLTVEVYNATINPETFIEKELTSQTGWARFQLSNGTYYSFRVFWKEVEVGSLLKQQIISNTIIADFQCSLSHVKVVVKDESGLPLPYIDAVLVYGYMTRYNETVSERVTFETRENGTIFARNMITNANYTIETRRHGSLFNRTQISNLNNLLMDGWANITIICPTYTLFTHVMDSNQLPLPNMEVEVYEWSSQILVQAETTNDQGSAAFNFTFGRYKVVVYSYSEELKNRIILNETIVDLIEDQTILPINCKIFNVTLSVKVVDYFGQPIPDAMIELERFFGQEWVKIEPVQKTDVYGIASMPKIGGDYRISVYASGDLCETRTLYLDEPKLLLFKVDKYTMVSGYPLETRQFITYISLGLLIALLVLALSYRRIWKITIRRKF